MNQQVRSKWVHSARSPELHILIYIVLIFFSRSKLHDTHNLVISLPYTRCLLLCKRKIYEARLILSFIELRL